MGADNTDGTDVTPENGRWDADKPRIRENHWYCNADETLNWPNQTLPSRSRITARR